MLSISVNQPLVTRVAVAPIVVTKRLAHFFNVVPRSSVLSVSDTREVFIATPARLSRAVVAPEAPHKSAILCAVTCFRLFESFISAINKRSPLATVAADFQVIIAG